MALSQPYFEKILGQVVRIKITLAYDGSRYYGFQVQKGAKQTVASELYEALHSLNIHAKIIASGRTDRDVHATGQVIHIDLPSHWKDIKKLQRELTRKLSGFIHIKHISQVSEDFHARFGAKKRLYRYIITTKKPTPYESAYLTYVPALNIQTIKQALPSLEGTHDFKYFQKSGSSPTSTVRTIFKAKIYEHQGLYILSFEANSFLRSQIRMIVAFLLKINEGVLTKKELQEQLALTKRHSRTLADPNGLYLAKITY